MPVVLSAATEVLGGLGIFFFALQFLSKTLKQLSSQRLRQRIARLTERSGNGIAVGAVMITVTQSASASVFLLVGLVRAGMLTLRQAQPVLLGVNIAAGLTVLFLTLDIHPLVMSVLAASGIAYAYGTPRLQRLASAGIGIGLLFLGLHLMREGASIAQDQPWFDGIITQMLGQPVVSFCVAALLTVISQSSLAVVILMTALLDPQMPAPLEAMMFVVGANVGASILTYLMSSGLTGVARQVAFFQVGYNLLAAMISVPLLYVEALLNVPLMAALVQGMTADPGQQVALVYLAFNLAPFPLLLICLGPCARALRALAPETVIEQGSKPRYLTGPLPTDPRVALRLIELEQKRLISLLIRGLDTVRHDKTERAMAETQEAFRFLAAAITAAIDETTKLSALNAEYYDALEKILSIQNNLEAASGTLSGLVEELLVLRQAASGISFPTTATEGLDVILSVLADVARNREDDDIELLARMTDTKADSTRTVRAAYFSNEDALPAAERIHLLAAVNYCERLIWLSGEVCDAYRGLKLV